jgi:crotonobetainyl-CoA:carnitine CoA-transferase CaiB-like acyl-CoA transferase
LRGHPDFRSNDDRVHNRQAMNATIEECLKDRTSAYWVNKLNTAGVPCDRVMTLPEVFADPQVQDQEMVVSAEHPGHGEVKMLGFPIKFSERRLGSADPPPTSAPIPTRSCVNSAIRRKRLPAFAQPGSSDGRHSNGSENSRQQRGNSQEFELI